MAIETDLPEAPNSTLIWMNYLLDVITYEAAQAQPSRLQKLGHFIVKGMEKVGEGISQSPYILFP